MNTAGRNPNATAAFRTARNVLLDNAHDLDAAREQFQWPQLPQFNWALDWFDVIAAENGERTALRLLGEGPAREVSYAELSRRSDQVANWLRSVGVRRGDRLLMALHNRLPLYETMLAAIKLGAVVVPTYATATTDDLADRLDRAKVRHVLTEDSLVERFADLPGGWTRINTGARVEGWANYADSETAPEAFDPQGTTRGDDPLFVYFTSGTTSRPKMVLHTHTSYPVGHLSGMYWNGVRPGDVHLNISAPGWAKHAWSSFFVPFNAEATIVVLDSALSTPTAVLDTLREQGITTFCAPPTVWRGLLAEGLGEAPATLREATCAGEPLEATLISTVEETWGVYVRDGYGQTETTGQIGHTPGRRPQAGVMGRPLPGYRPVVVDPKTGRPVAPGGVGELCLDLTVRPTGIMVGYAGDQKKTEAAFAGGYYHTGDLVRLGEDGELSYVGRDDDMFKSFDYRISPLELERVLLGHPAVEQAAVVPVPDPVGMWIPKAFVLLAPEWAGREDAAELLFQRVRAELPAEKWVKVLEFVPGMPTTISGKIRRAELRTLQTLGHQEHLLADLAVAN